jgi:starch phosphorylase
MIKNSIRTLAPMFSTGRMVTEYATRFYMTAAEAYQRLEGDGLARAKDAREWRDKVQKEWGNVKIVKVEDDAKVVNPVGATIGITAVVRLGALKPSDIEVQAVIGKIGPNRDLLQTHFQPLEFKRHTAEGDVFEGKAQLPETGHQGYTVRVLPSHPDVHVASELGLVSWQAG